MWVVNIALRRPYTFIVMALLIILATPFTLTKTPVDILPEIDVPVVSMVWQYNGLSAAEVAQRITNTGERTLTTIVDNIEHIESQSLAGITVIKIFFQPNTDISTAIAQIVAVAQIQLRTMPAGTSPPLIIKYSATSIPVIQLGLSSKSLSEQQVLDLGNTVLRPKLVTIPGVAIPFPYGGKLRVISVDLNTEALHANGLAPSDVVNAVNSQNLLLPSGTIKTGEFERPIKLNGSPETIAELNELPIRTLDGATIFLKDVAQVRDGFSPQTNIIRQNGERGVLITIIKNGTASTLKIVNSLKELLPEVIKTLPKELNVRLLSDQSIFVKSAIAGVFHEALIAGCLTAAMILLFLGNWRSTLIITVSIPLSIMAALLVLQIMGETLNMMTLGGLALAIGILVDDATVTIENIERHLHHSNDLRQSILAGAGEIAMPTLVSTLCICIVFVPMFFLAGIAKYLFAPMAIAVIAAMIASYILSRTLVPTLVFLLMRNTQHTTANSNLIYQVHTVFNKKFDQLNAGYRILLSLALKKSRIFIYTFLLLCVASCSLFTLLGRDFFPAVDSGQIRLHMRAPTGTRVEETARITEQVNQEIRKLIPAYELASILDNIGLQYSGINLTYSNSGTIGTLDSEMFIELKPNHRPSSEYVRLLRKELPKRFPGIEFFFQPADIVSQILNFGLPASINIQLSGRDLQENHVFAKKLLPQLRAIPGAVDVHIHQRLDLPGISVEMDRVRAQQSGLSAANLAQNLLISLSGSFQTAPSYWLNPNNGVVYNLAIQSPQYRVDSVEKLLQTPIPTPSKTSVELLGNFVQTTPHREPVVVSRYNLAPVIDILISVDGRDLGGVAADVETLVNKISPQLPGGTKLTLRGQVETMKNSYIGLSIGLCIAIVLIYLLIVINFQSLLDPFIIITALPAALAGIAWILFLTGTPLSVPALVGTIMTMGIATANSVLLVSFARQHLDNDANAFTAALEAASTRLRPVLMTALAIIIGMMPMAFALGEGGEQNAPLGIATIGGLILATCSTLFFVPVVFAEIHQWLKASRTRNPQYA